MITITHNRATFTVNPQNAEPTRELLALIDKSKGRKGRKLPKDKGHAKHNSMSRFYPTFYLGMSTAEYIGAYTRFNAHLFVGAGSDDTLLAYTHADRPAPMLDPSIPEVTCDQ